MGKGSDRKGVCDEEQEICLPSSTFAAGEEDLVNEEESEEEEERSNAFWQSCEPRRKLSRPFMN